MKKMVLYIHTVDGVPAQYWPKEQVCFRGKRGINRFCKSLKQIKREQKRSMLWRIKQGWPEKMRYGSCRLVIDLSSRRPPEE